MVDDSVRQASVTSEFPRVILKTSSLHTRLSIEVFIPQSLERVPQQFTFWGIQRRTGTDSSLQLEKRRASNSKKGCTVRWNPTVFIHPELAKHAVGKTIRDDKNQCGSLLHLKMYGGAGQPVCVERCSHPSSANHPRRRAMLIWSDCSAGFPCISPTMIAGTSPKAMVTRVTASKNLIDL